MAEPQIIDTEPDNTTKYKDGYYTKSRVYENPYLYTNSIEEQNIDYSKIGQEIVPYKPFLTIPKISTPNITIKSVNNVINGLILVLASASLFVPIAQIGGKSKKIKTQKNKAQK